MTPFLIFFPVWQNWMGYCCPLLMVTLTLNSISVLWTFSLSICSQFNSNQALLTLVYPFTIRLRKIMSVKTMSISFLIMITAALVSSSTSSKSPAHHSKVVSDLLRNYDPHVLPLKVSTTLHLLNNICIYLVQQPHGRSCCRFSYDPHGLPYGIWYSHSHSLDAFGLEWLQVKNREKWNTHDWSIDKPWKVDFDKDLKYTRIFFLLQLKFDFL